MYDNLWIVLASLFGLILTYVSLLLYFIKVNKTYIDIIKTTYKNFDEFNNIKEYLDDCLMFTFIGILTFNNSVVESNRFINNMTLKELFFLYLDLEKIIFLKVK